MANILNLGLSAVATGVDTITATYSPAITLTDRRIVYLRTAGTNATTTPTFNPNGLGAQTITKGGGSALAVGDLDGDVILMYDLTNTNWELLTPKTGTIPTLAQVLDAGYLTGESGIYSDNALNYLLLLNAYIAMGFDDGLGALANLSLTATESQINFLNNVASGFFKVTETESGIQHDVKVKIDTPNVELTQETASLILSTDASKNIKGLSTTTYPSFTELAHVKGVTSAIQTQLNAKLTSANIVETITNGVTTNAPSENAVFDALALKSSGDISFYRKAGTTLLERWYSSAISVFAATTVGGLTKDVLRAVPFVVPKTITLDRIAMEITIAGTAGSVLRLGIYSSTDNLPGALVLDAGTIACDSATFQSITINQQLTAGLYWLVFNHNSAATPTFRAITLAAMPNILGVPAALGTGNYHTIVSSTYTYGALPDPYDNTGIAAVAINAPLISVRLSA